MADLSPRSVGRWAATGVVATGLAYVIALGWGMWRHGLNAPIEDPVLAVMEVLTLVSAPLIVGMLAGLAASAAPSKRIPALGAIVFGTLFAGATSVVHFVQLTAERQLGRGQLVWPSVAYAVELAAWDLFLGLALCCAALTLEGTDHRRLRRGLWWCGVLCLVGLIGPAAGNMRLQLVGVVGYAVVLPLVAVLARQHFGRMS